jgi:hypothetical protein
VSGGIDELSRAHPLLTAVVSSLFVLTVLLAIVAHLLRDGHWILLSLLLVFGTFSWVRNGTSPVKLTWSIPPKPPQVAPVATAPFLNYRRAAVNHPFGFANPWMLSTLRAEKHEVPDTAGSSFIPIPVQ